MAEEWTDKKEKYSQLVVSLGNKSEALRQSYDCSNMTDKTINETASRLSKEVKVTARIEVIRNKTKASHNITREKMVQYHLNMIEAWEDLWQLGKKNDKTKDEVQRFYLLKEMVKGSDYRGSASEISRLTGLYEPEKHDHTIQQIQIIEKQRE